MNSSEENVRGYGKPKSSPHKWPQVIEQVISNGAISSMAAS